MKNKMWVAKMGALLNSSGYGPILAYANVQTLQNAGYNYYYSNADIQKETVVGQCEYRKEKLYNKGRTNSLLI